MLGIQNKWDVYINYKTKERKKRWGQARTRSTDLGQDANLMG
jgi:hypothetical protein